MGKTQVQAVDSLRKMWRMADAVVMAVKAQGREDEGELIERVNAIQDEISGVISALRATKEPGA